MPRPAVSHWVSPLPKRAAAPERVGVVDQTLAHVGDGLEAAMGMLREAGDLESVVHPPAVDTGEVGAELAPRE